MSLGFNKYVENVRTGQIDEFLDIDDEEEYHRVQSEIRERRKRFRQYDELLAALLDTVTSYANIATQPHSPAPEVHDTDIESTTPTDEAALTISESEKAESVPAVTNEPEPINNIPDTPQLAEQAFFEWLVSEGGVSESTAKQYISNIHSIECSCGICNSFFHRPSPFILK